MRKRNRLIQLQTSLHLQGIERRELLSDVPYESLRDETRSGFEQKARTLFHPEMMQEAPTLWRFLNRE